MGKQLRVAVIGAGPAGIYASDILTKSDLPTGYDSVSVDILEADPTPFGLIRYGVAPDHPRIKEIIKALHRVMSNPDIRFFGNITFGRDLKLDQLHQFYDAVIFATGARHDRGLDIPGIDLRYSYGAADFVSWYDAHPDAPRTWDFGGPTATSVAVLGVGNVGLDVARILAKTAEELLVTEIPDNVYTGLKTNPTTDVHVFARRGPAQVKFSPLELRELGELRDVDMILYDEDFDYDEASKAAIASNKQVFVIDKVLNQWRERETGSASRRLHLHFFANPIEVTGSGAVEGFRYERTEPDAEGGVRGTGEIRELPIQAIYRAVGYFGSPLDGIPFDERRGVIPNREGQVLDDHDQQLHGVYATGWIKRGPVGLIGHTKSDAMETIKNLMNDEASWWTPAEPDERAVVDLLDARDVKYTTLEGWHRLDEHEIGLGEPEGRARIKVVSRDEMVRVSRAE